ncbi:hypothetical protein HW555_011419, partial [Spodoptera exigua]
NRQNHEPTCAYSSKFGLTNYFSVCEINFQICILGVKKETTDKQNHYNYGEIYYNGLPHPCGFYQSHTTNGKEAIDLYYNLGA